MPEYWRTGTRSIDQLWGIDAGTTAAFVEEVSNMLLAGDILQSLALCGVGADRGTTRGMPVLQARLGCRPAGAAVLC